MRYSLSISIILSVLLSTQLLSTHAYCQHVQVDSVARIPNKFGLAGAFIGKIGQSIYLIGGTNFEQGYPWEGGKKCFHNKIYTFTKSKGIYTCVDEKVHFPKSIGHGCSASLHHAVFCFGGQTSTGLNEQVYRMSISAGLIKIDSVSVQPFGFRALACVVDNNMIYVLGDENGKPSMYSFEPIARVWKEKTPYPGMLRTSGVLFTRLNNGTESKFYLMGGRTEKNGHLTLHKDVIEYDVIEDKWTCISTSSSDKNNNKKTPALMAAATIPFGKHCILVFGGDDGVEFAKRYALEQAITQAKSEKRIDSLKSALRERFIKHPGFSDKIWCYHVENNKWIQLSGSFISLPVVTTAIQYGNEIIMMGGEIKPAIRSAQIFRLKIKK